MQNHYSIWQNLLILGIFLISLIYSLPNLFGEDPSVQVSSTSTLTKEQANKVEVTIKTSGVTSKAFEFKVENCGLAQGSNGQ
jgi:preprotein translocase subunit SecD